MRILLDSEFPQGTESLSRPGITVDRWSGGGITDRELAKYASGAGYHGLALLGRDVTMRTDLLEEVSKHQLGLVVVSVDSPTHAHSYLDNNLHRLRDVLGQGKVFIVRAREVEVRDA